MAVRTPLKLVSSNNDYNLQAMTSTNVNAIVAQAAYMYGTNPSVVLTVSSSNTSGALSTLTDTRKLAGTYLSNASRYPYESETPEPTTTSVSYRRVEQGLQTADQQTDNGTGTRFPVYLDSNNNLRAMTETDFKNTFIHPAIDYLTQSGDRPGIYRIHTGTSLTDHSLVSGNVVFTDTRANTSAYTSTGIPETTDQPISVTNYYLHRANAGLASNYTAPMYIDSNNNIRQFGQSAFNQLLLDTIRYVARSESGYRIRYSINGSGVNKGSGMADTILNGSGNYQERFVNQNDYRAQEFPNGSAVTGSTYRLRVYKT